MNAQSMRLAEGGRVDRSRPVRFAFNGRSYEGYAGDTLASALLANGVTLVGRSFKYHRPRGIFSAGPEEPNALVQLESGSRTQPNLRSTQVELYDGLQASSVNAWPSVGFDFMRVNDYVGGLLPAGFYYKTFMWPRQLWLTYEHVIRRAAGLGEAPAEPDPDRYERHFAHCDVLVIGAGPTGLAAGLGAARTGARVMLVDEQAEMGGQLLARRDAINDRPAMEWAAGALAELAEAPEVVLLSRTTAFAYQDHNMVMLAERVTDHLGPEAARHLPRQRLWQVRAKHVVLSTGAIERPMVFSGNDRPGVMLAGAARAYANRFAVRPGRRAVFFTNNDDAYGAAVELSESGVEVTAIVDVRESPGDAAGAAAIAAGIEIIPSSGISETSGGRQVSGVTVRRLNPAGDRVVGASRSIACDLVATSGGWNPAVHLFSHTGGKTRFDDAIAAFVPDRSYQAVQCTGAVTGVFGLNDCLSSGIEAGRAAALAAGITRKGRARKMPSAAVQDQAPLRPLWVVPDRETEIRGQKHFLDLQNDVTVSDVFLAAREGYHSVEHLKRYTTLGMGTDQGKTGNIAGHALLAAARGVDIGEVGTTTFRAPYTPVTLGTMAGRDIGELADPVRRTPLYHWHESVGAVFEDVGQWKRPFYYPQNGESKDDAVNRECLAVRDAVGIMDATTLGKIEIHGPDATTLLNRLYTNAWNKLEIGRCRYGLMLGEDGMVIDDGVTSRLAEQSYLMTTTSGNAASVLAWLEEWVQTEWPELKVYMNSVTEFWATITVCGPKARDLMGEIAEGFDFSNEAFPFMSWRDGQVAGVDARVFRVSFTGEASYEINVKASYGLAVWTALMGAGEKYGITPFGTEAMHVLRAEKGFIIVGQDTDGTVTPGDLGMDWIVSKKKDFIGRRSLSRVDTVREDRKHLVGLKPTDPDLVLPEGAHIVSVLRDGPPMPMLGHVTSSYYSAALGHGIALALIKGGRSRLGDVVDIPLPLENRNLQATVVEPVFYDPEGSRLRG